MITTFLILLQVAALSSSANSSNGTRSAVHVASVYIEPFLMISRTCEANPNNSKCQSGNDRLTGYVPDLLNLLASRLEGFDYVIVPTKGNNYGAKLPDGKWNGLLGDLINGEADVAVAPLTINKERAMVVDFSTPFMSSGISIMIKKPDRIEICPFFFFYPLSRELWTYVIVAYLGVALSIFIIGKVNDSCKESSVDCNFCHALSCPIIGIPQGLNSPAARIVWTLWIFFTFIIATSYIANLTALLSFESNHPTDPPVEGVEDLIRQTNIEYGVQRGGSTAQFFKNSQIDVYQSFWKQLISNETIGFVDSYSEGIARVRQSGYAFLLEEKANDYVNTRKPCDTMKVDPINLAILALQESGELKRLENQWWYDRGQCNAASENFFQMGRMNFDRLSGVFLILLIGIVIALLIVVGEFVINRRKAS